VLGAVSVIFWALILIVGFDGTPAVQRLDVYEIK
jgi:K+ transporter